MAIAKITITCTECGRSFDHRKQCYNRSEADNYEAWAAENVRICPECYRKHNEEEKASKLAECLQKYGINLQEIEGVSQKQIDYAKKVRQKCLADHMDLIKSYSVFQKNAHNPEKMEKFAAICAENGVTLEYGIKHNMEAMGLTIVHVMLTSTSAKEILDAR